MSSTDLLYYIILDAFALQATPKDISVKNRLVMLVDEFKAKIENGQEPPDMESVLLKLENYANKLNKGSNSQGVN